FRSDCVNRVRFDAVDPVFFEPTYIVDLYPRCRLETHLVNGPAQSGPKCDGPPVVSRAERLNALLWNHLDVFSPTVLEQLPNRYDVGNSIPWVECAGKIRPFLPNCDKPTRVGWLKNPRPPCRHRKLSTGSHHAP